jgi:hypothetical protein
MVGILARLPQAFIQEFTTRVTNNNGGPMLLVIEIIIWLLVIICLYYWLWRSGKFQFNMRRTTW